MEVKKALKKGLALGLALAMVIQNNSYYTSSSLKAEEVVEEATNEVVEEIPATASNEEVPVEEAQPTEAAEVPVEEPVEEEEIPVEEETAEEAEPGQEEEKEEEKEEEESDEDSITLSGTYKFDDEKDTSNRPSTLTVTIKLDGEVKETKELEVKSEGSWEIKDLEKTDKEYTVTYDFDGGKFYKVSREGNNITYTLKEKTVFKYEDSKIVVTATVTSDNALPESFKFVVKELTPLASNYKDLAAYQEAEQKLEEYQEQQDIEFNEHLVYDMHFENGDGEEVEPDGMVTVEADFKQPKKLSDDATSENTSVLHLDESVNQLEDVTQSVNVTADGSIDNATFTTGSFSTFIFVDGRTQKNTWDGTVDMSYSTISGALGTNADFAVVANTIRTNDHIEGNIRVGTFVGAPSDLNSGSRFITNNGIKSIQITKNVVNGNDGPFTFGLYEYNAETKVAGSQVGNDITITTSGKTGTITLDKDDPGYEEIFKAINKDGKTLRVFEKYNGQRVDDGGKCGDFTVSYEGDESIYRKEVESNITNYIGTVTTEGSGDYNSIFHGAKTVVEDLRIGRDQNNQLEVKLGNYKFNNANQELVDNKFIIEAGLSAKIASELSSLAGTSAYLANAKNTVKEAHGDMNVINIVSTTGTLSGDLAAANFGNKNGKDVIDGMFAQNQTLLINIDVTGYSNYSIDGQNIYYDGKNPQGDEGYSPIGNHVIYNFVTRSGDTFSAYTGNIKVSSWSAGLLFAPLATVDQSSAYWVGSIIANDVTHAGSEIHKKTNFDGEDRKAAVTVTNTGEQHSASGTVDVTKYVNGMTGAGIEEFEFKLSDVTTVNVGGHGSDDLWKSQGTYHKGDLLTFSNQAGWSVVKKNDATGKVTFDLHVPEDLSVQTVQYYLMYETSPDNTQSGMKSDQSFFIIQATWKPGEEHPTVLIKKAVPSNGNGGNECTYHSESVTAIEFHNTQDGKLSIPVIKTVTGKNWDNDGETFEFTIEAITTGAPMPAQTTVTLTKDVQSGAFGPISYSSTGTYQYKIKETKGSLDGFTYDDAVYRITVYVTKTNKQLVPTITKIENITDPSKPVEVTDATAVNFTNEYSAKGDVQLEATKQLDGTTLTAEQFEFTLSKEDGSEIETKSNDATGKVQFSKIEYTKAGTYKYTIKEVIPSDATLKDGKYTKDGYTYDGHTVKVTVVVTDNGNGTMTATPTYEGGSATFANAYDAKGSITFEAKKELTGRALKENEFSFTITEVADERGTAKENAYTETVKNDKDGNVKFTKIDYTLSQVGTYYFAVKEDAGDLGGVTYDNKTVIITVTVADKGDGTLEIKANKGIADLTFGNTYEAKGKVKLEATKQLTGKTLAAGQFSFELKDSTGKVLQTKSNAADGKVTFDEINYTAVGEYTYTIKEVIPTDAKKVDDKTYTKDGYTYDGHTVEVTVVVTDNGDGTLTATPSYAGGTAFANAYGATGFIELGAKKELTGRELKAGEFSFTITEVADATGTELKDAYTETVQNAVDGTITFSRINYTTTGTHYYKVTEEVGQLGGVDYSKKSYVITVTVTDNGDGTLTAEADKNLDNVKFTNTYTATGKYAPEAKKALTGRVLKDNEFSFVLTEVADAKGTAKENAYTQTVSNNAKGEVKFSEINYTLDDVGTHYYKVVEKAEKLGGVTYTDKEVIIAVTVTDNGDGTLSVTADKKLADLTFTNAYEARGSIDLEAKKVLNGRALKAGEFEFTITAVDEEGKALTGDAAYTETVENDAEGKVAFTKLTYELSKDKDQTGKHYYKVVEDAGNLGGVTYDKKVVNITITVKDNGDGTLSVTSNKTLADLTFTNTYAAEGSYVPVVKKVLNGRDLDAGEFLFTITEVADKDGTALDGATSETKANAADGTVTFSEIKYTQAGTHYYKVTEDAGQLGGVDYSDAEYVITVTVVDNGDGTLTATADQKLNDLVFTNEYKAIGETVINGKKKLDGRPLNADEFQFDLNKVSGETKELYDTKANAADGSFSFGTFNFELKQNGLFRVVTMTYGDKTADATVVGDVATFTFEVNEKAGSLGGVTYDKTVQTVTITVKDNGNGTLTVTNATVDTPIEFVNTYGAKGEYQPAVQKVLNGRALKAGEFSFTITEVDSTGKALDAGYTDTQTNAADGTVTFKKATYTTAGTHYYQVVENAGRLGGVTYTNQTYTITVTVTDNGDGTLTATADQKLNDLVFTNTYAAEGSYVPEVKKVLNGRDLAAGEFSFKLVEVDEDGNELTYNETVANDAKGKVTFSTIAYTLDNVGTHYYKVVENVGQLGGVDYSDAEYVITVTVSDKGDGTLKVEADKEMKDLVFTNEYDANGSITLNAKKVLNGRELKANEFEFTITAVDEDGKALTGDAAYTETVKNDAEGKVAFSTLSYELSQVGDHYFEVVEKAGSLGGVQYSDKKVIVKVTVSDNGNGTLNVVADKTLDDLTFINTYGAKGSYKPEVKKVLTGRDLAAGEFSFTITEVADKEGTELAGAYSATASNDAEGKVSFESISYTVKGVHYYKVVENAGELGGVTYTNKSYIITVNVTDNGDGTLKATADKAMEDLVFTNKYDAEGSIELKAKKTLTGRDLKANEFSFTITASDKDGKALTGDAAYTETVKNDAEGKVAFSAITYKLAQVGTYYFTVKEDAGKLGGVTYDNKTVLVTVTVADNGDGTLSVTADKKLADLTFANTYDAKGSIDLEAKKVLTGRDLAEGEFEFTITEVGGDYTETVANAADGSVTFSTINYVLADVGEHYFKVVEVIPADADKVAGVTYTTKEVTIKVTVTDNGDGTLNVVADKTLADLTFTNTYAADGSIVLQAKKVLKGRDLKADEFSFKLTEVDKDGNALDKAYNETVKNAADGTITFSPISYDLTTVGKHYYKVEEILGDVASVTYTEDSYIITVTVKDNGDSTLDVSANKGLNDVVFTNTYEAKAETVIKGTKELEGRTIDENEFEFNLLDEFVIATVSNTSNTFEFGTIKFVLRESGDARQVTASLGDSYAKTVTADDSGVYTFNFTVNEKAGTKGGVTYSQDVKAVTVTVKDNGDGTLAVTNTTLTTPIHFINTYEAEGSYAPEAKKVLTGRELAAGEFSFTLTEVDAEGNALTGDAAYTKTVVNDKDGKVAFPTINYTLDNVGTHYYKVVEDAGRLGGVTYDKKEVTIAVTVTDKRDGTLDVVADKKLEDLTFANTYEANGEVKLVAYKQLNGGKHKFNEGDYSFTLTATDKDGNPLTGDDLYHETVENGECEGEVDNFIASAEFSTITYNQDQLGTHYYTIKEIIPEGAKDNGDGTWTKDRYTYDGHTILVTVEVTDNGDGTLTVVESYDDATQTFKNEAEEIIFSSVDVELEATKHVNKLAPKENEIFTFNLVQVDETGAPVVDGHTDTKQNVDEEGKATVGVTFEKITYSFDDLDKTYYYEISEEIPVDADENNIYDGVAYDADKYIAAVTIIEVREKPEDPSELATKVVYTLNGEVVDIPDFLNKVEAEGVDTISGKKQLVGKQWDDLADFTFELSYKENAINVKSIDKAVEDHGFAFDEIRYELTPDQEHIRAIINEQLIDTVELDGTTAKFEYTVTEKVPTDAKDNGDGTFTYKGTTYDKATYTVVATVEYIKKEAKLEVSKEISKDGETVDEIEFTNCYEADGKVVIEATKTINGKELKADDFSFDLIATIDGAETTIETAKNSEGVDSTAPVTFSEIEFALSEDQSTITATYVNGKTQDATVTDNQAVFTYTVKEVIPEEAKDNVYNGVTYDQTVYTVVVTVTHDHEGNLTSKTCYYVEARETANMTFINEYKSTAGIKFDGKKKLDGKSWAEIDAKYKELLAGNTVFTLYVMNPETKQYEQLDTATLGKDGTFSFLTDAGEDPIKYEVTCGETKKYTYKVVETKTHSTFTLDTKAHVYEVEVIDQKDGTAIVKVNGVEGPALTITTTFNNKTGPHTGIQNNMTGYFVAMIASAAGVVAVVFDKKRKAKK